MIKNLTPVTFGDRDTRDKYRAECVEMREAATARGDRFVVAPRHTLPSERGLLPAGTPVTAEDFEGFTSPYPTHEAGVEQLPLSATDAIDRAVDLGIVLRCRTTIQHRAHDARVEADRLAVEAERLAGEANEAEQRAVEAERQLAQA